MNGHPALPAQTLPISQFWLIAALKPTAAVSNNVPISPPRLAVQISSSNALALLKEIGATHLMDLLHPLDRKKAEKTLFQTYCGKSFERTFSLDGRCLTRCRVLNLNQIARDRAWEGPLDSGTGAFVKVSASNINGSSKLSSSACENEEKEREKKDGGGLACKTAAATATSTSKRSSNASITAGSSNSLLSPTSTSATSSTYSSATLDVLFIHSDAIFIRVSYDENPADVAHTSTPLKDIVTLKSYFSSRIQTSSSTTNTAISSTTSSSNARLVQLVDMNSLVLHHAFPGDAFTQLSGTHLQQQQQSLNFSNIWNLDFQFSLMITNKWKLDRTQQAFRVQLDFSRRSPGLIMDFLFIKLNQHFCMVIAEDAGIRQRIVADARALALKYLQQPPVTVVNKYIVNAATNSAAVVPESTKLQQQSQHPTPIEKPIPQHTSVPSTCASSSSSSSSSLLLSSKCLDTAVLKRKLEALADSAEAAAAEMDQTNPRKHEARSVIPVISTAAASLNNNRRSSMSDLVTGPANSSSLNEVHLSLSSSSDRVIKRFCLREQQQQHPLVHRYDSVFAAKSASSTADFAAVEVSSSSPSPSVTATHSVPRSNTPSCAVYVFTPREAAHGDKHLKSLVVPAATVTTSFPVYSSNSSFLASTTSMHHRSLSAPSSSVPATVNQSHQQQRQPQQVNARSFISKSASPSPTRFGITEGLDDVNRGRSASHGPFFTSPSFSSSLDSFPTSQAAASSDTTLFSSTSIPVTNITTLSSSSSSSLATEVLPATSSSSFPEINCDVSGGSSSSPLASPFKVIVIDPQQQKLQLSSSMASSSSSPHHQHQQQYLQYAGLHQSHHHPQQQGQNNTISAVLNDTLKACLECGKTDTPEWRYGPTGPKSLCNSCGLKYSRFLAKLRKQSEGGNTTSNSIITTASVSSSASVSNVPSPRQSGADLVDNHLILSPNREIQLGSS